MVYPFTNEMIISMLKVGDSCDVYIDDSKIGGFELSNPSGSAVGFCSTPQTEINVDYLKVIQF